MNNQSINEINKRSLDPCFFSFLVISTPIFYKENNDFINEKEIYTFLSCNIHGKRKYITSVFKDSFVKTSEWYDFLLSLKSRGISIVLYAVIPNNDALSKALKLVFSDISIFISCYDAISKLFKYYSVNYSSNILKRVRNIFLSPDINSYEIALREFKEEYLNYQFILDILEDDLNRARNYYNVDYNLRRFIFSFYFTRDISKRLRSISHSKPYFSSLNDFVSLFIPDIQKMETKMFCSKKELNNVINIIYNDKKDLIISYL